MDINGVISAIFVGIVIGLPQLASLLLALAIVSVPAVGRRFGWGYGAFVLCLALLLGATGLAGRHLSRPLSRPGSGAPTAPGAPAWRPGRRSGDQPLRCLWRHCPSGGPDHGF